MKECGPETRFQTEVCNRLRCFQELQQTRVAFQRKVPYLHFTVCHSVSYLIFLIKLFKDTFVYKLKQVANTQKAS